MRKSDLNSSLKKQFSQNALLPALPEGVSHLIQALTDNNIDNHKLAAVISHYPTIAARLLFLANSAWATPPIPVTNLKMACARLGLNIVKSVSIALAISSPFNPHRCHSFDAERYWSTALLVAEGAVWFTSTGQKKMALDTQVMHTAGLLHNIGLLWLADNKPLETALALEMAADKSVSLNQALRQVVSTDYCEVGSYLGSLWGLPNVLVAVMGEHRNLYYDKEGWQYVATISYVVTAVSAVYMGERCLPDNQYSEQLNIDAVDQDAFLTMLESKLVDIREMAQTLFSG